MKRVSRVTIVTKKQKNGVARITMSVDKQPVHDFVLSDGQVFSLVNSSIVLPNGIAIGNLVFGNHA